MAIEIERKFLLQNDTWKSVARPGVRYRQGYLCDSGPASVRVRIGGQQAYLNIKSATLGVQRSEYEYEIAMEEAEELLAQLARKPLVEKTRYCVAHAQHIWEIDVFEGDNAGLVVAEIELRSADESFERPPWLGAEVSDDPRYYNVCLVEHPYKDW